MQKSFRKWKFCHRRQILMTISLKLAAHQLSSLLGNFWLIFFLVLQKVFEFEVVRERERFNMKNCFKSSLKITILVRQTGAFGVLIVWLVDCPSNDWENLKFKNICKGVMTTVCFSIKILALPTNNQTSSPQLKSTRLFSCCVFYCLTRPVTSEEHWVRLLNVERRKKRKKVVKNIKVEQETITKEDEQHIRRGDIKMGKLSSPPQLCLIFECLNRQLSCDRESFDDGMLMDSFYYPFARSLGNANLERAPSEMGPSQQQSVTQWPSNILMIADNDDDTMGRASFCQRIVICGRAGERERETREGQHKWETPCVRLYIYFVVSHRHVCNREQWRRRRRKGE